MAPAANSTTALVASTLNQVISSNITFAAQSGDAGGSTSVQCAPQAGVIVVSANANQAVLSGSTVAPVTVSMSAGNQAQSATMRCTTKRVGEAPVVYDYNYTLNAIDSLFKNGFE